MQIAELIEMSERLEAAENFLRELETRDRQRDESYDYKAYRRVREALESFDSVLAWIFRTELDICPGSSSCDCSP